MKKIMYVLATVAVLALASSCGNRSAKNSEAEVAVDSTMVVVDSLSVAVDSTVVENVAE